MPSNNSSRRAIKTASSPSDSANLKAKEILILIKAAPLPSKNYLETVCTAGIDKRGNWYRLYPIPFRFLNSDRKFSKYQWIEITTEPVDKKKDNRKESHKPILSTIKRVGDKLPAGKWTARKKMVLPLVSKSIESLSKDYYQDGTSLGIIKPKRMLDFTVEGDEKEWKKQKAIAQSQLRLFGPQPKELTKVPYRFYYKFLCDDPSCKAAHKMSIHDWEIYALYLNIKKNYGYAEDVIMEKVRMKWFDKMWARDRDSYLFVGTVHSRYKSPIFVALGVFWPPK